MLIDTPYKNGDIVSIKLNSGEEVNQEANIKLNVNSVSCIAKTEKEMSSQYIQNTTGLTV